MESSVEVENLRSHSTSAQLLPRKQSTIKGGACDCMPQCFDFISRSLGNEFEEAIAYRWLSSH